MKQSSTLLFLSSGYTPSHYTTANCVPSVVLHILVTFKEFNIFLNYIRTQTMKKSKLINKSLY